MQKVLSLYRLTKLKVETSETAVNSDLIFIVSYTD